MHILPIIFVYSFAIQASPFHDLPESNDPETSEEFLLSDVYGSPLIYGVPEDVSLTPQNIHGYMPVVSQTIQVPLPQVKLTKWQKAKKGGRWLGRKIRAGCSFMKPITGVAVDVVVALAARHR